MQRQSSVSTDAKTFDPKCAFCQIDATTCLVMKETANFRLVADHAPLLAGHILIIPRQHYACYGEVPESHNEELALLKHEVKRFFQHYYAPPAYWEHGVFHQTVFHAHLHCFPIGPIIYPGREIEHGQEVFSQEDIRQWYSQRGHYFYLEDAQYAFLFPPDNNVYAEVVKTMLGPGVSAHSTSTRWRSSQERQRDGKPLIASLLQHWREFQAEEKSTPHP
jgi:diadenosine tetraphosphate (Ap4A) HIT family hydrolase